MTKKAPAAKPSEVYLQRAGMDPEQLKNLETMYQTQIGKGGICIHDARQPGNPYSGTRECISFFKESIKNEIWGLFCES
jgi:hypothetical protein